MALFCPSSSRDLSRSRAWPFTWPRSRATNTATLGNPCTWKEGTNGFVGSLGLLALIDAEQGRNDSAERSAREAISFARQEFQTDSWVASVAHLGLALACAATGRLDEAEREAQRGEQLRRSPQPTVGHAHALLILARVRVARSRLGPAGSDLERARRALAEFPDPGRLPALAAKVEHELAAARAITGTGAPVEEPSPAELAVLRCLATGLSRHEIGARLYISLNTVKTHHPRAIPQAGRDIGSAE